MVNRETLALQAFFAARAMKLRIGLMRRVPFISLPQILAELTPIRLPRTMLSPADLWPVLRVSEAVCRRSKILPDTCLYRALTRYALLRRAGHEARFVMGMDPRAREDLTAHAWVELGGVPYQEALDPRLVVTYVYPDTRSSQDEGASSET